MPVPRSYVADDPYRLPSLTVYSRNAQGDVPPLRTPFRLPSDAMERSIREESLKDSAQFDSARTLAVGWIPSIASAVTPHDEIGTNARGGC
jgi:hypothetical protein